MKNTNRKIISGIILLAVTSLVTFALVAVVYLWIDNAFSFDISMVTVEILTNSVVWVFWLAAMTGLIFFIITNIRVASSRSILKRNELENSKWLTIRDMKKNKNLTVTSLKKLHETNDGIPIYADKKGKDIKIVLGKPIHTIAIGGTGSGKTTGFVEPIIDILSRTKTKPCMVITDPKGELYAHHAQSLKDKGYNVACLDLVEIERSVGWNPFGEILAKTDVINNVAVNKVKNKYEFLGEEYLTYEEAELERKVYVQILENEIYEDIQDIVYTICPIENRSDSTWQKGARDLIFALALAFWEDVRDGIMREEQLCMYNLYKNIGKHCNNECSEFKEYFKNREQNTKTADLANTVLISQDRTLTSYLGDVNQYLSWMADTGISNLTSRNETHLSKFDEEANALFIKIPDHRQTRHRLVTLFITQLYKALVNKAALNEKFGKSKESTLLRNAYIIMDEFGNLPKFNNIDNIITVGRSRGVFMLPIIQDYAQLDNKYEKSVAAIIKSNCMIKIYIGSEDEATRNEFSNMCGKTKIKSISYSEGRDTSMSIAAKEKPLIYASELRTLNDPPQRMGNAIVIAYGKNPLRAKYTPIFKATKIYKPSESMLEKRKATYFDESKIFYDIAMRNAFLKEAFELKIQQEKMLESLVDMPNLDQSEQSSETDPMITLYKHLETKEKRLRGKVPDTLFDRLARADLLSKLEVIEEMQELALDDRNNFLAFDLADLKIYITDILAAAETDASLNI